MAEITIKRSGELLRAVFQVLKDQPDGLEGKEVLLRIQAITPPTAFEKAEYPNRPGVRRYEKIVRFHTVNAVKAGWMIKTKGIWALTDEGRKAFSAFPDPERFAREARRLYQAWKTARPSEETEAGDQVVTTAISLEEADEAAWAEIESYLQNLPPYDFQNLVAVLLRAMGYHVSWIAPPGRDGGFDILAYTDPLGTRPPRMKVQVKRRGDKITVDGIRSFMALLGDQDVGIFVSVGGFTGDAESEARSQEKRRITLLNLEQLFDLWVEHYAKIPEDSRKLLPLKPIYYLDLQR